MRWMQIEGVSYWSMFVAAFLGVAIWESFREKRRLTIPASRRWSGHGLLFAVCAVTSALVLRVNPVFTAVMVSESRFGLLNKTWIPFGVRAVCTVLLLDLVKYGVHRALHSVTWLWRVHQVHHSDPDFDVSTATRAHPIETLLTQGAILGAVVLLAPPASAVFAAELMACFESFFQHANASLPGWIEKPLRGWIITPDIHRVHHANQVWEQSRNLGETFPWWDQLWGTYSAGPRGGDASWAPGLAGMEGPMTVGLGFMLGQPLHGAPPMEL